MQRLERRARRFVLTGTTVLALLSLLSVVLDGREFRRLAADTNWVLMPAALGFATLAYAPLSYAFARVAATVGIRVPRRTLLAVGFVSITLSQFAGGGMAGYAARLVLMRQHGSRPGDVLAASLLYSSLGNLVLLALLPVGLGYLLADHPLSGRATTAIVLAVGLLVGLVALATVALSIAPGCFCPLSNTRSRRRPLSPGLIRGQPCTHAILTGMGRLGAATWSTPRRPRPCWRSSSRAGGLARRSTPPAGGGGYAVGTAWLDACVTGSEPIRRWAPGDWPRTNSTTRQG